MGPLCLSMMTHFRHGENSHDCLIVIVILLFLFYPKAKVVGS